MKISGKTSQKIKNMSILCAMFVVLIHIGIPGKLDAPTWIISQILPQGIANIAVPFFFILSGFFLAAHFDESGWWPRETWKRVKTLLIPFYLWTAIYVIAALPLSIYADYIANRPFGSSFYFLKNPLHVLGFDFTDYAYVGQLWYVRCLFIFVLISPVFAWLVRRLGLIWLGVSFVCWMLDNHTPIKHGMILFTYGFSFAGMFFFSLGLFLRTHRPTLSTSRRAAVACAIMGLSLVCAKTIMYYNSIPCRIVVSKLSLIPLLYASWHFMPAWKIPMWLTSCSFAIYVLHELFFTHISLAFQKLNLAEENSPLQAIVKFVVGFLGSIALTLLIRRFLPRTARTLFGGR